LKLHIGCGDTYLDGWVNIDMARPARKLDLRWDLRRGLPFSDGSAEAVFSEHFLEHLDLSSALEMMQECRRVLKTGGVCRIGVPDFERYVNAYFGEDSIIRDVRGETPTRAIAINEIFYFHGHRSMYDAETLSSLLHEAGFSSVRRSTFGESTLSPCPDSLIRQPETLYVEAIA
jgi:predicted SAM-dependent methyltransferase